MLFFQNSLAIRKLGLYVHYKKSIHINFFTVKDKVHQIGGSLKFNIMKNVLQVCSQDHIKYVVALKEKREAEQQDERKRLEKINLEKNRSLAQQLEEIEENQIFIQEIQNLPLTLFLTLFLSRLFSF